MKETMEKKVTAVDVLAGIAKRHAADIFLREVKDGPTQTVSHYSRIDALAIKKSWTNFTITGYEVKVSRGDFMRDVKWRAYLPMCHQLYFAAPPGIILAEEVPEACGLVQLTATGGIRTVKKAPWREIPDPVEMYKYIMFTYISQLGQLELDQPRWTRLLPGADRETFQRYAGGEARLQEVGRCVSMRLGREISDLRSSREGRYQEKYDQLLERVQEVREALGILEGHWFYDEDLADVLKAVREVRAGGLSEVDVEHLRRAHDLIGGVLKGVRGPGQPDE